MNLGVGPKERDSAVIVAFLGFGLGVALGLKVRTPGMIVAGIYIVLWHVWLYPWFQEATDTDSAVWSLVLLPVGLAAIAAVFFWWLAVGTIAVGIVRVLRRIVEWVNQTF